MSIFPGAAITLTVLACNMLAASLVTADAIRPNQP
jgi:ABC-type dipeptide/oligopeptide/nickel transport system permease subunit